MTETNTKLHKLNELLTELGTAAVGFSGGEDSAFLAAAAHRAVLAGGLWPARHRGQARPDRSPKR